jgi:hypothetical protein
MMSTKTWRFDYDGSAPTSSKDVHALALRRIFPPFGSDEFRRWAFLIADTTGEDINSSDDEPFTLP